MGFDELLSVLDNYGFEIEYSHIDEKFFGNIIILIKLNDKSKIKIIKEKGTFECYLEFTSFLCRKEIPIKAIEKMEKSEHLEAFDATFLSAEELIDFLVKNKPNILNFN
ncbi:MAG: hypothetical protein K0R71_96 [Bacillales bacterium]|jgi:hypothetical protein|nr:hypothetical protein [Bacillales bacterium]